VAELRVILFPDSARGWETALVAALEAAGHHVRIAAAPMPRPSTRAVDRALDLEARRFGPHPAQRAAALTPMAEAPADLIIDLTGAAPPAGTPVLRLAFAGQPSFERGLGPALRDGLPELIASLDGVPVGRARPMINDRVWATRASADLLAGAIALVEKSVARFVAGDLTPLDAPPAKPPAPGFLGAYLPALLGGLSSRALRRLRPNRRPFYWQVGYRLIDGQGVAETGDLSGAPFLTLPDDGQRLYADPFVFVHDGETWLLVEDMPYATGRGVISAARLGPDGTFGPPRPVLEEPFHLSFPQIFARNGEILMLVEGAAGGEFVLYRAERFPDRWRRDTVLLDHGLGDPTLLEKDGRLWLFATEKRHGGNYSDTLSVFSARDIRGPFTPHRLNPVLIDRFGARPGGAFLTSGGRRFLPVQDGSRFYGGGLGLAELTELSDARVRFAPPRPITTAGRIPGTGIHTLNRAGHVEVIDWAL
jgi:hypothetical protein